MNALELLKQDHKEVKALLTSTQPQVMNLNRQGIVLSR